MRLSRITQIIPVIFESYNKTQLLNALKKSKIPTHVIDANEGDSKRQHIFIAPSNKPNAVPLGSLDENLLSELLDLIIDSVAGITTINKYTGYLVYQVAKGYMPTHKLDEDIQRFIDMIEGFIKYSKKSTWQGSKNLYDYDNWKDLEKTIVDLKSKQEKATNFSNNKSEIIFEKTYIDENAKRVYELLGIGEKPPAITYYLRRVTSVESAYKYGRGTQWCTASDEAERILDPSWAKTWYEREGRITENPRDPRDNLAAWQYLVTGLFIIEKKVDKDGATQRGPIMQISGDKDIMTIQDSPVVAVKGRLYRFLVDLIPVLESIVNTPSMLDRLDQSKVGASTYSSDKYYAREQEIYGNNMSKPNQYKEHEIYSSLIYVFKNLINEYQAGNKSARGN